MLRLTPDALLTTTRSVRKRLDFERAVPRATIQACLEIALQAPNGSNLQLWQWLVVDDRETVAKIAGLYNEAVAEYAKLYAADTSRLGASRAPGFERMTESVMHLAQHLHRAPALVIPCMVGRMEKQGVFEQARRQGLE